MVANRALALGAVRGAFQERLFIGDTEVTFPSLESVVEFVRRTYLRSGGGDGEEGGGGETPPPLVPGERPLPPLAPEALRIETPLPPLTDSLSSAVSAFQKLSCKFGQAEEFLKWPRRRTSEPPRPKPSWDGVPILASATLRFIQEFLLRLPDADLEAFTVWHESARRFGDVLGAMGLWEVLGHEPYRTLLVGLMKPLSLEAWNLPSDFLNRIRKIGNDDLRTSFLCSLLFARNVSLHDDRIIEFERFWPLWPVLSYGPPAPRDRIADLCRIPVPKEFEVIVRTEGKEPVSLYHALTAFIGSPLSAANKSSHFFELVLFAASWIALPEISMGPMSTLSLSRSAVPELQNIQIQRVIDAGWNWLREHLPTMRFATEVERTIESASDLRYRAPPSDRGGHSGHPAPAHA
jgi:hypothetical protein